MTEHKNNSILTEIWNRIDELDDRKADARSTRNMRAIQVAEGMNDAVKNGGMISERTLWDLAEYTAADKEMQLIYEFRGDLYELATMINNEISEQKSSYD